MTKHPYTIRRLDRVLSSEDLSRREIAQEIHAVEGLAEYVLSDALTDGIRAERVDDVLSFLGTRRVRGAVRRFFGVPS